MYIQKSKYSYDEAFSAFKEVVKGKESLIIEAFNLSLLEKEVKAINEIESIIPEKLRFELELNLLFEKKLTQYNKDLFSIKKNQLFESIRLIKGVDPITLEKIKFKLNETDLTGGLLTADRQVDDIIPTSGTESEIPKDEESGGILSFLKSIWNALTEGGSPIGILHLILDIVGLIPGIGMAADALNAGIYVYREKYMMAIISMISMIPFGDTVKIFRPVVKFMNEVLFGGKKAAEVLVKVPSGQKGLFMRFLLFLKNTGVKAIQKVLGILSSILSALGKWTGWIPGLGPSLKSFFDGIASKLTRFSDDFIKRVNKATIESATLIEKTAIDDFTKIGEVIKNGGKVQLVTKTEKIATGTSAEGLINVEYYLVTNSKGLEKLIPIKPLEKLNYLNRTFPKGFEEAMTKIYGKEFGPKAIVKYYETATLIAKATDATLLGKAFKFGKSTIKFNRARKRFFGKLIFKYLNGGSGKSFIDSGEIHSDLQGDVALWSLMDERMKKDLEENPGQTYSVPKIDDMIKDKEMYQAILDQQNTYARKFGQPNIIPVAYYIAKNSGEDIPEEVNDFMKDAYTEDERKNMQENITETFREDKKEEQNIGIPKYEESNESINLDFSPIKFKYLIPYSKF